MNPELLKRSRDDEPAPEEREGKRAALSRPTYGAEIDWQAQYSPMIMHHTLECMVDGDLSRYLDFLQVCKSPSLEDFQFWCKKFGYHSHPNHSRNGCLKTLFHMRELNGFVPPAILSQMRREPLDHGPIEPADMEAVQQKFNLPQELFEYLKRDFTQNSWLVGPEEEHFLADDQPPAKLMTDSAIWLCSFDRLSSHEFPVGKENLTLVSFAHMGLDHNFCMNCTPESENYGLVYRVSYGNRVSKIGDFSEFWTAIWLLVTQAKKDEEEYGVLLQWPEEDVFGEEQEQAVGGEAQGDAAGDDVWLL